MEEPVLLREWLFCVGMWFLGTMGQHMTALSPWHREFPGLLLDKMCFL